MTISAKNVAVSEQSEPATQRSTAVLVLGAGRSGTSAITRGVQALGVDLGDKLRPPGGKNPTGFFEDQDLLALNKRLKRQIGIRGHNLRLLDDALWDEPGVKALHNEAVATVRRRFAHIPLWGFKYARTLRMLPFWERVFDELNMDVRYVLALRNPLSVARSRGQLNPQRGSQAWSDMEWLVNVVPYFAHVRGHALAVVDFDAMLADPAAQLQRVATGLGIPLEAEQQQGIDAYAKAFLRPGMRHSQFELADLERDPRVYALVSDAYTWLHRLAHDEVKSDDPALWEDWARMQKAVEDLAPILAEFDLLRAQLGRALWNPASPAQALRQVWRDLRSR